jgi:DNA-binding MarR family transcriptional regulator
MAIEATKLVERSSSIFSQSSMVHNAPSPEEDAVPLNIRHLDLARDVERVHRRYLDLLRAELTKLGVDDVSPAQVLMLFTIGTDELSVRDLLERGNYLGSNASYNLKRLFEAAYIERQASSRDRRSARIRLAPKGHELCATIRAIDQSYQQKMVRDPEELRDLETTVRTLRRVEVMILTTMKYGDVTS